MMQLWAIADGGAAEVVAPMVRIQPASKVQSLIGTPRGAVAFVDVLGVLTPYGVEGTYRGGVGTSVASLIANVERLRTDASVSAVCFCFDSPGGKVTLIPEAGDAIAALTKAKPTISVIGGGFCCSGGVWLASQTGKIFATRGSVVGSVGAYIAVTDLSGLSDRMGIKVHVIRSSPLKGIGVPGEPITDAVRADLQRMVDAMAALFRDALGTGRKMNTEQLAAVETGQVWRAGEAAKLKLIDGVITNVDHALTTAGWTALLAGVPPKPDVRVKTPHELQSRY